MDWMDEVSLRLKRKNQVLFSRDSAYLQDLTQLFRNLDHRALALWAFDFAAGSIARLEAKYSGETRPSEALTAAQDWAAGAVKMQYAQRKILDCHAFAKELTCREDIATCHAIGQACSVVHTAGHAIGYPIYDLTATVHRYGIEHCAAAVEQRKQEYIDRLFYWNGHWDDDIRPWAVFMCKDRSHSSNRQEDTGHEL